jgi:hypothetical protein
MAGQSDVLPGGSERLAREGWRFPVFYRNPHHAGVCVNGKGAKRRQNAPPALPDGIGHHSAPMLIPHSESAQFKILDLSYSVR